MAGLLGEIFSAGNVAKRKLTDLLGNPVLSAQQMLGNLNDRARVLNQMTAAAAKEGVAEYGPETRKLAGLLADAYNPIGLTVYHGSPAKFTKFDPTKIGSGEGAQAYGYGHYVAEAPGVAKEYQEVLASPRNQAMAKRGVYIEPSPAGDNTWRVAKPSEIGRSRGQTGDATQGITDYRFNSPASAIKYAKRQGLLSAEEKPILTEIASEGAYRPVRSAAEMEDRAYNQLIASEPGYFYEIDLPDEQIARMLDWDKPLSEQPLIMDFINRQEAARTKSVLDQRLQTLKNLDENSPNAATLKRQIEILREEISDPQASGLGSMTGGEYYNYLRRRDMPPDKQAEMFRNAGIPGIRYLDQGSRGTGEGTSNFVVFPGNEGLLTIQKRNNEVIAPTGLLDNSKNTFETSVTDASEIFGQGAKRIRYTDPSSGGMIDVLQRPDGTASVLGLEVPEAMRGQGIGQSLQSQVMQDFPEMMGQVSSKAAAKTAYRLGRRPPNQPDATLDDVYKIMDEYSSVNLVSPEMQKRFMQSLLD